MLVTITVPLYVLLIVYALVVICVGVFVAINIYHIFLSASFTVVSFLVTFFVISSQIVVFLLTFDLLQGVDYNTALFTLEIPSPEVLFNQDTNFQ